MRVSAKAEYACLALAELARSGNGSSPIRVREVAQAHAIPERYLVQILLQLKAAGLVQSTRGAEGGYFLSRAADEITVADVIASVDGPGEQPRKAGSPAGQALAELLEKARAAERDVLSSTTIARLAGLVAPHDWVL